MARYDDGRMLQELERIAAMQAEEAGHVAADCTQQRRCAGCGSTAHMTAIFWLGVPKFGIQTTRTLQKKSSISAESSRRDTSKSEVFSVLGALACTHDLLKVRPKCHYGVFFAQNFSLAKEITLANLTMHIYEVWTAGAPK